MNKRLIILNLILLIIILIDKPILNCLCGKTAVSVNLSKNITGFGIVDRFNNKQGKWFYRSNSGNVLLLGDYKNNKKEGEWLYYEIGNSLIKTHFKCDTLFGAAKRINKTGSISDVVVFNGDDYYGTTFNDTFFGVIVEWNTLEERDNHYQEFDLARKIYNTEYGYKNDDPFNHKVGGYDTLALVFSRLGLLFRAPYPIFKDDFQIEGDYVCYVNQFDSIMSTLNYILLIIIVVVNIVNLIPKK